MRSRRRTRPEPTSVPRAVLDTNVLVSALISPGGPSAALLLELRAGAFELVVSPALLAELREVLGREKFRRYVTEAEAIAYVDSSGTRPRSSMTRRRAVCRSAPIPTTSTWWTSRAPPRPTCSCRAMPTCSTCAIACRS